jgi:hypothetical protein
MKLLATLADKICGVSTFENGKSNFYLDALEMDLLFKKG